MKNGSRDPNGNEFGRATRPMFWVRSLFRVEKRGNVMIYERGHIHVIFRTLDRVVYYVNKVWLYDTVSVYHPFCDYDLDWPARYRAQIIIWWQRWDQMVQQHDMEIVESFNFFDNSSVLVLQVVFMQHRAQGHWCDACLEIGRNNSV